MISKKDNPLDDLMEEAFREFPGDPIPDWFSSRLVSKLEKKLAWQDLLLSFGLKVGIVLATLALLVTILFFTGPPQQSILDSVLACWKPVATVGAAIFFTFLFDQVLLPTLFHRTKV